MKKILVICILSVFLTVSLFAATSNTEGKIATEYLVLGGFGFKAQVENPLLAEYAAGEMDLIPFEGMKSEGKTWVKMAANRAGNLNFITQNIQPAEHSCVYAHVFVNMPKSQKVRLGIGSDDGSAVIVNGVLVHQNVVHRGWELDQDILEIPMSQGWNRVLCKVFNGGGGFDLSLTLKNPDGSQIPGLRFFGRQSGDAS